MLNSLLCLAKRLTGRPTVVKTADGSCYRNASEADSVWPDELWQALLSSPMDARHYMVQNDWAATVTRSDAGFTTSF
jgi:hypothetical protein